MFMHWGLFPSTVNPCSLLREASLGIVSLPVIHPYQSILSHVNQLITVRIYKIKFAHQFHHPPPKLASVWFLLLHRKVHIRGFIELL